MVKYLLLCALLFLLSCSESSSKTEEKDEFVPEVFANFPEQPFLNINWAEANEKVSEKLAAQGYELQLGSEDHFYNSVSEIEFVIADFSTHLVGFKVFMKSEEDLKNNEDYLNFFNGYAKQSELSDQFSTFEIHSSSNEFKITQYVQEDFIRFEFTLKDAH